MCKYSNNEEPYMKHWRYILLTSLTMLLWGGRGFAQQRIYGSVADHVDGEYLPSVSVSLLQRDSVKIQSTVTNERGRYSFDSPGKGSYILQFTSLGYKGACKDLVVSVPKRITEVDAGLMRLKREATLLGEVKVTATKIKMFQRGDTVVYNADAFSLAEGSMLQVLVSQLPGVTLNDDGRIYVNGRFVSSLLLNGRDFFKGNPLVALENLPAYTVKTVKVYDKAGEATRLLGRDAGDKALVMDVNLKREYNEGYIANADMGCGSSDRYKAQLFGLRFTHLSRLALFGNLNNVNSNKQPGRQGDWKGDDTPTGRQKTVAVGGEYSYENRSHNVGFSLTPTFSRLKTDNQAWTSGQTYLDNALLFTRGQTANLERPAALSTKGKLWTRKKKWSGELYAEAQYEKKSVESLARSASFMNHPHASTEILDSIVAGTASLAGVYNYLNNSLTGNGENYKLTLGQTMRMKVGGDLLSADAEYSYTKECHNTRSLYQLATYHSDASRNQRTFAATNNHMYQLKANLRYQMFLSGKFNDFLLFRYGFSEDALRSSNPFSASPYHPSGATQGGPTPPDSLRLDQANSYSLSEHHYKHTLEARFRYSWKVGGQLLALSVAVPVVWHHDLLDELRGARYHLAHNKVFVDPEVVLSADKFVPGLMQTAIVGFNLSHAMPQLPDMVPFEDTRLPHRVVRGNPLLGNIQKVKTFASFTKRMSKHQSHFVSSIEFCNTQGAPTNALFFNTASGIQTLQPHNTYGNWKASLMIDAGRAIALNDRLQLSNKVEAAWLHTIALSSTDGHQLNRNPINNLNLKEVVQLTCDISSATKVGLYASATMDRVASEPHEFDPYTVGCYAVGCNVVARLPLHMQLATDIRMLGNYGYSDTQMHKKELVWNARLTKSLMKGRLQLMLDGYDLLRQISNRHYIINAQGRLEQYTNAIPRYVMMHAAFKINKNPKKK